MSTQLPENTRNVNHDFVEQVKDGTNLAELISETVQLKRAGSGLSGLCCFLADRKPSFSVSPDRGLRICFSCGAGGDSISWMMRLEGLSFWDSVRRLAQRAGIDPPHFSEEQRKTLEAAQTRGDILTETARYYHAQVTPETRAKIRRERGFTNATIEKCRLREQGRFTEPAESSEALEGWQRSVDPVREFAHRYLAPKAGQNERLRTVYHAFAEWSKETGRKASFTDSNFKARLVGAGYEFKKTKLGQILTDHLLTYSPGDGDTWDG
ncbi:MAG: CHC2 zinc finger domain-containing protein [Thermodesulfobacteriota bacterium]